VFGNPDKATPEKWGQLLYGGDRTVLPEILLKELPHMRYDVDDMLRITVSILFAPCRP